MIKHGFSSTPYDRVSWCYDMVAHCYSIGQIRKAKSWHSKYLKTGDRALYAGVGSGNEISGVIRAGVQVVAIDNSNSMINLARSRIVQEGLCADLRLGDIFDHKDVGSYDAVIANFFLNLFPASEIPEVLERLISFLRPGGHLYIGDFASAQKGFNALCRYAYFMPVLAIGRIMGICKLHNLHSYERYFECAGLSLQESRGFSLGIGPSMYYAWRCHHE